MRFSPLLIVLGVIIVAILIIALPIMLKLKRYESDAKRIGTKDIDLSKVADGVYAGSYDSGPVIVKVEVTVKDHVITKVDLLKHRTGQGQAADSMPARVLAAQSIKVDTVSGATMSSKVILLAIERALAGR